MPSRFLKAAVAALAGLSILAAAAPTEASGPRHHRSRSDCSPSYRSHGHSHHRSHYSGRSYYPGRSNYHRSYNPYRFHRTPSYRSRSCSPSRSHHHRSSYRSYRSYPSYSISFGYGSGCDSYSSFGYGFSYSYPIYSYPKRYDSRCRPYSSGVYLSYDKDCASSYGSAAVPRVLAGADVAPPPVRIIDASNATATEVGFKLLAAGEHGRALSFFASSASSDLGDAQAKLGYALASAAQGNDDRALWAMRRAVTADASDLSSWPECAELTKLVDALKARYQAQADKYVHTPDRDALFMLAALNHVTGDTEAAKAALARSYPGGSDFYDAPAKALAAGLGATPVASTPEAGASAAAADGPSL